jgi:GTPase
LLSENAEEELLLPYEPENGNVEYKLKLQSLTMDRVDHLTTQLIWRLEEGDGTAFY